MTQAQENTWSGHISFVRNISIPITPSNSISEFHVSQLGLSSLTNASTRRSAIQIKQSRTCFTCQLRLARQTEPTQSCSSCLVLGMDILLKSCCTLQSPQFGVFIFKYAPELGATAARNGLLNITKTLLNSRDSMLLEHLKSLVPFPFSDFKNKIPPKPGVQGEFLSLGS